MEVVVNYLAVLVAAIASMVVGYLWYGVFFKKSWMAMMGYTSETMGTMKMKANTAYAIQFVASLLMAYVLYHGLTFGNYYLEMEPGISGAVVGSFWMWLGFIVPVSLGVVLWENKPWKLWAINASHYLVSLIVMGVILSYWM